MLKNSNIASKAEIKNNNNRLIPENNNYKPIPVKDKNRFSIIGKVKGVVRWIN